MAATSTNPTLTAAQRLAADASEIAHRVGVSASLVRKVLAGTRQNAKVTRAYQGLLAERANAVAEFQKGTEPCA